MAPGEESQDTGRPRLIRPLLDVTRDQIEQYCTEHHLQPRRDPTNVDRHYTRNRIRHELLPQLIEYNPHIVTALSRTAAICADDYAFIQTALAEVWDDLVRVRAGGIDFAGHVWQTLHPALQREALRKAHKLLVGNETLTLDQIEHARAMIERGVGRRVELPGALTLTVGYAGAFTIGTVVQHGPQLPVQQCVLPVPGQIRLEHGWRIETAYGAAPPGRPHTPWEVYLDAEKIGGPLLVRRRRPGDRVRLAGKSGSRRVQDLFVDAKVPRALRDAWPIVVAADMIVWVAGVRAADDVVATATARQDVRIRVSDENLEHNA